MNSASGRADRLAHEADEDVARLVAGHADFDRAYTSGEIAKWLHVFYQRFFANQFKRSCLPDGPKVGTVSLSPRGDWRMPSDAVAAEWLRELDLAENESRPGM